MDTVVVVPPTTRPGRLAKIKRGSVTGQRSLQPNPESSLPTRRPVRMGGIAQGAAIGRPVILKHEIRLALGSPNATETPRDVLFLVASYWPARGRLRPEAARSLLQYHRDISCGTRGTLGP